MTETDFVKEIEKYYGPYDNEHRREIVREYLKQTYTQPELNILYRLTIQEYSSKYKTVPDVAVFKDLTDQYNKANGEWYRYAGGHAEFLGQSIGINRKDRELLEDVTNRIEDKTGQNST
jgi:hypothetical protein